MRSKSAKKQEQSIQADYIYVYYAYYKNQELIKKNCFIIIYNISYTVHAHLKWLKPTVKSLE